MTNRRHFVAALAASAAALPQWASAQGAKAKYRVVMHVGGADPRGWNQALNNAALMARNLEGQVTIRMVTNGAGVNMLIATSPAAERVALAQKRGVTMIACGETMKALSIDKDDLLPGVTVVDRGLVEILDRQMEGWQYLRVD